MWLPLETDHWKTQYGGEDSVVKIKFLKSLKVMHVGDGDKKVSNMLFTHQLTSSWNLDGINSSGL